MPSLPAYPAVLTATEWSKKKGLVAKIVASSTKLGDALRDVEAAYKGVEWKEVFAPPTTTLKPMDQRLYNIKSAVANQYNIFRDAIKDAKIVATKARDEWNKNPLVPKDAKTYLDNVIKALDPFFAQVDTQQKAAYKILVDSRNALAAINPKEAAASNQGATQVIVKNAAAAKSDTIKTKFKPPPAPASAAASAAVPPPAPPPR